MAKTYIGGSNNVVDFVLYQQNSNQSYVLRLAETNFIPSTCTINIGDTTSGFDGTLSDFRIFTDTSAIPGMSGIYQQNCPQGAGLTRGVQDPCFGACYDINCIECDVQTVCTTCNQSLYLFNDGVDLPTCPTSCPFYYVANNSLGACVKCTSGQVFFNGSCLNSCPKDYIQTSNLGCARCDNSEYYYNHSCVNACPISTFANTSVYECQPCYLGCDSCMNVTKYGCLTCSTGYFYYNYTCNSGCPPDMYADPDNRTCEACQPPCMTCSKPNNLSCTNCPAEYYILNGTCVTSCPVTHYQGFLGDFPTIQVPACLPKLILYFNLTLTLNPKAIYIGFSYGIIEIILAISQRITIQIANILLTPDLYILSPITESMIQFQYLGDQYYPPLSLLNVTIDLDEDFESDPYEQFRTVNKSATIQMKEIYPFTTSQIQYITASSNMTTVGGGVAATSQTVSSLAGGGLSLGLVRMQIVGESVQMMRFFAIRWPSNVNQFFTSSNIDPTSIIIPVDFTTRWNRNLEYRNYSIARVFDENEISPFFTENYNNELSNLMIWVPIVVLGSLLINLLKKRLQTLTQTMKTPKTNSRKKCGDHYIITMQALSRFMNRTDDSVLWNLALLFILSIFQSGLLWSFLNIRYSTSLLEPSTYFTNGSLAIAILFLMFYLLLAAYLSHVVIANLRHVFQTKENLRPLHLKKYGTLFEDFKSDKKMQILFVPVSLIRSIIFPITSVIMSSYPFAQIIIFCSVDLLFITYMIVYQPLKDKWTRRITLCIEIFAFGCMTFGLIFEIVSHFISMDPTTLDEIGFVFIVLSTCSTFSGALQSLIQIIALIINAYRYLKKRYRKRKEIHPVSLEEYRKNLGTSDEERAAKIKSRRTEIISEQGSRNSAEINDANLIKRIGSLSPETLSKTIEGGIVLESIRNWGKSLNMEAEFETQEITDVQPLKIRGSPLKNRVSLFDKEN